MLSEERATLENAIFAYGTQMQCQVAMEELAELIQAISKYLRYGATSEVIDHLAEEIADVDICINEVKIMLEKGGFDKEIIDELIAEKKSQKLKRLKGRLENG